NRSTLRARGAVSSSQERTGGGPVQGHHQLANEGYMTQQQQPVVQMHGIVKTFPGVVANAGVDFDLMPGEVHTLLGENGAGKSTLMNVLYGLYHADEGEIFLRGQSVRFSSARDAIANGLGMVHQH